MNAADEIAVEAFWQGRFGFLAIYEVVEETLATMPVAMRLDRSEIFWRSTRESRALARELVAARAAGAVTA